MFKKYPKIYRLGHEDTDGILIGKCYIQEKIDGANVSIWVEDGEIQCGSRNRHLIDDNFNGFVTYVKEHKGIQQLMKDHPEYRLYLEWLVRHTVSYDETAYKQAYLYDIFIDDDRLELYEVEKISIEYDIKFPQIFDILETPTIEQLNTYVGLSSLAPKGEGIVIKNFDFINKFGNHQYAKIVRESFKEDNAIVFGGNNKHSDTYKEMWCVNKFVTLGRVKKIMEKLQPEINKRLDKEHTSRIINTVYHDILTEEIWTIQKKFQEINFKNLSRLIMRKSAQVYHDILNNNISIADEKNNSN